MIDFTNCRIIHDRAYNGANGSKIAVEYKGKQYMLKFPPSGEGKLTNLSYTNSCISEHIASSIFNMLGIKTQETLLGTYSVKGKTKIVCACKDFTAGGKRLFDFCSIKNTVLDSDSSGNGTELSDIMDTIDKQQYVSPVVLRKHFWNMFISDALLGNFDRHNGNWGFLYDDVKGKAEIAPVFDCGSCLLPQADDKVMEKVLSNEAELHARVFQYPTSAIKLRGQKINYYDFLNSAKNEDA
ncbi:MAG: HipA domain-containing protein, partial [Lachnospiraceae bacterium]|nr:HipA domain-containing protein [Lachnospiraceae bacterium]